MASLASILSMFLLPHLLLRLKYLIKGEMPAAFSTEQPVVSLIIVARNAGGSIEEKIRNSLSLNYPQDKLEIIVFSDGSTDDTLLKAQAFAGRNVRVFSSESHEGKINGMNEAVKKSSGRLLAFTDADVMLDADSLSKIVRHFGEPSVGGVCGNKVVVKNNIGLEHAQGVYTEMMGSLKQLESMTGSISSNDGTLYVIRRELYKDMPPAVTDDLYVCLSVVRQGYRFMFEPRALAFMSAPSKDPAHELKRRRRVVSTSLRGIFMLRDVLNPFRYGIFAINLFLTKVLRRALPVFLILFFLSSLSLSFKYRPAAWILIMQAAFYSLALAYGAALRHLPKIKYINRIASVAFYFCIGNYGMLLGLGDFLRGRRIAKW
jgi:cellulose synthase/poly-beta-1,6-N-acetylglucosamine synthase-like glycosyltransferase